MLLLTLPQQYFWLYHTFYFIYVNSASLVLAGDLHCTSFSLYQDTLACIPLSSHHVAFFTCVKSLSPCEDHLLCQYSQGMLSPQYDFFAC